MDRLLVAGDVGGTKTALALLAPASGEIVAEATFHSRRYGGLAEVLGEFLSGSGANVQWASLSVAGPVVNGRASLQNLGWNVVSDHLSSTFELTSVRLMNDLQATAYALPHLAPNEILTLQEGKAVSGGARAVVAPGTGLGEAFLLPNGSGYFAYPSEGGNADFAPTDRLQSGLLHFLQEREGHVSYEDVCSGLGIPKIYTYLKEAGEAEEPDWLAKRLAGIEDPTPLIVETALEDPSRSPICTLTLRIFGLILAAEAGNIALRVLATGGVYLGGGIPPRILPVLQSEWFLEEFRRKGWFADMLAHVPLHVIMEPRAALLGAARYGLELAAGEA